jgi:hypothetical protein
MNMEQPIKYVRRSVAAIALAALTLAPSAAQADWKGSFNAVQRVYMNGVPHTDGKGKLLTQYDPQKSLLPIAIYHALNREDDNTTYKIGDLKKAGFNTAFSWWGNDRLQTAKDAAASGMHIIHWGPDLNELKDTTLIKELAKSPATLGYNLDDEPLNLFGNGLEKRFEEIQERARIIKAADPNALVFHVESGWILPPATSWWVKLNTYGDLSAHDNYPINSTNLSLSLPQGIPETVALAAASNKEQKPVWFVVQSFEQLGPVYNFTFPTAIQQRCMVYTSIIHGATGLVHFSLDSFVTRDAKVVGISPNPQAKLRLGMTATQMQLRQSKEMWDATAALNAEIEQLTPAILSPTADVPYVIELDDAWKPVTKDPIRTLLKVNPAGGYILMIANVDSTPIHARFRFPGKEYTAKQLFNAPDAGLVETKDGNTEFTATAFDTRVFQIDLK